MAKLTLTDIASGYNSYSTYNANNTLIEAALENTFSLDGTAPNALGTNIDMNSYRILNLSTAVNNSEPVTLGQANILAGVTNPLTQNSVGTVLWPQTAGEVTASVTPTNLYYPPGDVNRYTENTTPGTTDMTTAIQNAIDSLPRSTKQNADIDGVAGPYVFDGGGIVDLKGQKCLISDTIDLFPNTRLTNGTLIADTGATWTASTGGEVDWVTVTAGGSNYTQDTVSVAFSGGAGSGAAATAIVQSGAVIDIWITNPGEGYTSAPTVTINDSGTGAGATATCELITLGKPMVDVKAQDSEFSPYKCSVENVFINCKAAADGIKMSGKEGRMSNVTVYDALHASFQILGCDQAHFEHLTSYSSNKYGLFSSYRWGSSTATTSNECTYVNFNSKYSDRAEIRTMYTNSIRIYGGTVRSGTDNIVALLGNGTVGGIIDVKCEHKGENGNPAFVIGGGDAYDVRIAVAPSTPSAHFKWLMNVGGNYNKVGIINGGSAMSARVDNAALAGDISPFYSDASSGLVCYDFPCSDADLDEINSLCRDMDGNDQMATKFVSFIPFRGWGNSFLTEKLDLAGVSASAVTVRSGVEAEAFERFRVLTTGEMRWGDGSAAASEIKLKRLSADVLGTTEGAFAPFSLRLPTATTTQLADITNTINTDNNKTEGSVVFNTTTNKPVYAAGNANGDVWVDATGVTAHTPV